jgi:hypothetical protein
MRFQPGFYGKAPLVTSLAFQTSATNENTGSITGPASIQAGDLLVLLDYAAVTPSPPAATVPSGFTQITTATGGLSRVVLSMKKATGAEASASLTGMIGNIGDAKLLYVFRGNVPITVIQALSVGQQSTDLNPTAQVVTASGGTPPLVVIGAYSSSGTVSPRTFTPAKDGEINTTNTGDQWLAYKIYNASPADVTIDMDDEGSENCLMSCYIRVS